MQASHDQESIDSELASVARDPLDVGKVRTPLPVAPPALKFSRGDLIFHYEADGTLAIALRVTNPGPGSSSPRRGRIEQAAFGAFVPRTPLTEFRVPRLRPGESTLITLRVPRTAAGGEIPRDGRPGPKPASRPIARVPDTRQRHLMRRLGLTDLYESVRPRYAGNLHVHIGARSVERHLSGPLRVHPGKLNVAEFNVGTEGKDAYRFELRCRDPGWTASLRGEKEIKPGKWYDASSVWRVILKVTPPATCRRGALQVHVEQQSTGRSAIVEFNLYANAKKASCY
jgi:hypothetical protein